MPGPIPKRSAERRRRNKDGGEVLVVDLAETIGSEVEIPAPPTKLHTDDETGEQTEIPAWHHVAHEAYMSLTRSGQAIFMEPSDWATAYALCETLSRELSPKPVVVQLGEGATEIQWITSPVNGAVLNAFLKGWASLMATEGDRRRLKIELDRQKQREAAGAAGSNVVPISQQRMARFRG